jgi:hypothetical protein
VAKVLVPKEIRRGFKALLDLEESDYRRLVDIAQALTAEQVATVLDESLKDAWPNAPAVVRDAFSAVTSLQVGPAETGESLPEFIDDVVDTLFAHPSFDGLSQATFRDRLQPFLKMPAFSLGVWIGNVKYDNQRNFVQARTLTDIRPVFSTDGSYDIERAVIVHNLKITYNEFGSREDFFVALDDNDITSLITVLRRAQDKSASIDTFLKHMSDPEDITP